MSKYKYRCGSRNCRAIHHMDKPPLHDRKCHCGGNIHNYSSDRKRNKSRTCNCDGWWFPHKIGSTVWCIHHLTGPTEQDYINRYGAR